MQLKHKKITFDECVCLLPFLNLNEKCALFFFSTMDCCCLLAYQPTNRPTYVLIFFSRKATIKKKYRTNERKFSIHLSVSFKILFNSLLQTYIHTTRTKQTQRNTEYENIRTAQKHQPQKKTKHTNERRIRNPYM